MKSLLKSAARTALQSRGYQLSRTGPVPVYTGNLKAVIGMLRPMSTGHDLIRIGGDGDGGYLVPDDLDGIAACFSPGVSTVATFEETLADDYGIRSYLADRSVDAPPVAHPLFEFEKKFLGTRNDDDTLRLQDWVEEKAETGDDLMLQMDIEDAEYDVIIDTPRETFARFRIIVIEFHKLHELLTVRDLRLIRAIFGKITAQHTVVHIHPNNVKPLVLHGDIAIPPLIEVTLLRNDRFFEATPRRDFPHPLDRANRPDLPDVILPDCWY